MADECYDVYEYQVHELSSILIDTVQEHRSEHEEAEELLPDQPLIIHPTTSRPKKLTKQRNSLLEENYKKQLRENNENES